ncbi:hypothetical protein V8C40DRAFT_151665 [Trichoderma camerunense]
MRIGMARFLLLLSFPFVFLSFLICDYLFFLQLREAMFYPPKTETYFSPLFFSSLSLLSLFSLLRVRDFPSFIGHSTYFFKQHSRCKLDGFTRVHCAMWAGLRDGFLWRG